MLKLYYADISCVDPEDYSGDISEYRKKRLTALAIAEKCRQSLGAEFILNHALKELVPQIELPADIEVGHNGKPFIKSCPFYFSIAHSGAFAACVVSDIAVGLDMQQEVQPRSKIIERVFSEAEKEEFISYQSTAYAFTKIWTMKESYAKLSGDGIGGMLAGIDTFSCKNIWHEVIDGFHFAISVDSDKASRPEEIIRIKL